MKFDHLFGLEQAAWAVLLLDRAGVIRGSNQFAATAFGPVVQGESSSFGSLWPSDAASPAEEFITRLDRSPVPVLTVKLLAKAGSPATFRCYISSFTREQQKFFVLQLFRESTGSAFALAPPPMPGATAPAIPPKTVPEPVTVDAGLALKQKLDCALQLTRTVALDFNNALTSILGHTSLILGKMPADHPWHNSLVEVEKSAEKAAEIAHDLSAFSRAEKVTTEMAAGNLNELIHRTVGIFQRNPEGSKCAWNLHLEPKLFGAKIDEAKIQQAVVKILDNALQALSASGGQVTIATRNHSFTAPEHHGTTTLAAGHYVSVEVTDNGLGITPDILPRVFEPFFTTKPGHRGLGLAWVYGIVTNHGGSVSVLSEPELGTTVKFILPAQKKANKGGQVTNEELFGHETILVVDDEPLVLTMTEMILPTFGFRVLSAESGEKAMEIFRQQAGQIDLVITDLVMPGMSGRELIQALRGVEPGIRVLCTSGMARAAGLEEEFYLQKPFTSQGLLRKVKEVLS